MDDNQTPVLLVDSECAVCNLSVNFIRKNLKKDQDINFYSLYSDDAEKYLKKYNLPSGYKDSLVYIENDRAFLRSDAALRIARRLKGLYPALGVFRIIPKPIRDYFYKLIAKHRHRIF